MVHNVRKQKQAFLFYQTRYTKVAKTDFKVTVKFWDISKL